MAFFKFENRLEYMNNDRNNCIYFLDIGWFGKLVKFGVSAHVRKFT